MSKPERDPDAGKQDAANSAPEIVEKLIRRAELARASDIHLQMRGDVAEVSFRLDGVLNAVTTLPGDAAERVFGRIKYLAKLKTYQDSLPQEGRIGKNDVSAASDIRVATYPTVTGEKIVLRLFQAGGIKTLGQLEFPDDVTRELRRFLAQSAGLMLLTGPAGSGKTTTIYACLHALAEAGDRHIITIEDPAEQVVPGVMQTEINEAQGLSFASAARHLLRQDPQVLVIGEIRDEETANLVVRAALTGHLVISTLHAGSCKGVFERLLVLCHDHSAIASSLELVLNQRLVRRYCLQCYGKGCTACVETGYRGRLPIIEMVVVSQPLRRDVSARNLDNIRPQTSVLDRARCLLESNLTSRAEVERTLGAGLTT